MQNYTPSQKMGCLWIFEGKVGENGKTKLIDWLTAVEVMDLPEFDHCTNAYHNWFQEILNSIL